MVINLKGYRVFIASPGGLQDERKAFREALITFNDVHAIQKNAVFLPVGWEDTPGGMGRAQSLINEQIRICDYFVLVLWDRWGTPPSKDGKFSSGTEEEFYVAEECVKSDKYPMRNIAILFKHVDPKQLSDPGQKLSPVLSFKTKLEEDREHLYEMFDSVRAFERLLDRHLGEWLRAHEGILPKAEHPVDNAHTGREALSSAQPSPGATEGQETLNEARRLAGAGRRTEAEALFAKEVVQGESARAFLEYGQFLRRDGRRDQALTMVKKALELARTHGEPANEADAYLEIGILLESQGDIDKADEHCRAALKLNEELGRDSATADCLRNLGLLFSRGGDLESAETMYRKALSIDERLNRRDAMADDYSSIGSALHLQDNLAGAEEMHRKALEIDQSIGRTEAVAKHYGDLGSVRYTQGDWAGAEEMYREALKLDEGLGHLDAMADDFSNLGNVLVARGDLDRAEEMHKKAVDIDERLERFEGLADHYENLAVIEETRGRRDIAESLREQSRSARQRSEGT